MNFHSSARIYNFACNEDKILKFGIVESKIWCFEALQLKVAEVEQMEMAPRARSMAAKVCHTLQGAWQAHPWPKMSASQHEGSLWQMRMAGYRRGKMAQMGDLQI